MPKRCARFKSYAPHLTPLQHMSIVPGQDTLCFDILYVLAGLDVAGQAWKYTSAA